MATNYFGTTYNNIHYHFHNGAVTQPAPGGSKTASNKVASEGAKAAKAVEAPKGKAPDCVWVLAQGSPYYVVPASPFTHAIFDPTGTGQLIAVRGPLWVTPVVMTSQPANTEPAKPNAAGFYM